jgi:hypothetical protein
MEYKSNKLSIVIALVLSSMSAILSQTFIPMQTTAQEEGNQEPDIPKAVTETYPLEKIEDNKFVVNQPGIKTLEVIGSFPDGEHISYTMLVDIKENGESNY